jgi:predicted RNA-binding Zn-ribbon protein involved in translation (DUF1610 family)
MKVDKDKPELKTYSLTCVGGKDFYTKAKGVKDKVCPDCGNKKMYGCIADQDFICCDECGFRDIYTDVP